MPFDDQVVASEHAGVWEIPLGTAPGSPVAPGLSIIEALEELLDGVNVTKINGSTEAAEKLGKSARTIVLCTVDAGSSATSIVTSACSPAHSPTIPNQFVGRPAVFLSDTITVALRGQATNITASSASATPVLTVDLLTATPVSGDTFEIC